MDEFLKLKWKVSDVSQLEKQASSFIPESVVAQSNVYRHIKKPIKKVKRRIKVAKAETYIPGDSYVSRFRKYSCLNCYQQEMCLNGLKTLRSGKQPDRYKKYERTCVETYNNLRDKILEENKEFLEHAKMSWQAKKASYSRIRTGHYIFGRNCLKRLMCRPFDYGKYYNNLKLISYCYEECEDVIDVHVIQNLLEVGILARFSHHNLKTECVLSNNFLPEENFIAKVNSKLPVSLDKNIERLLETVETDFVISSSGLKQLLDNTDFNVKWNMPVIVKTVKIKQAKAPPKSKNVIFIDKPFKSLDLNNMDLTYFSLKRLLKTVFCQYEAFRFPRKDIVHATEFDELKNKLDVFEEKMKELDKEEAGSSTTKIRSKKTNKIHHNASYRLWRIRKFNSQSALMKSKGVNTEIKLLVRTKTDACEITKEGALQPVILKPKIELQLEYGANIPTKSELSREWTSMFFRPFTTLYRVRTHWNTAEVVNIEKCPIQKVVAEASSIYQYKPHLGLGLLQTILNGLKNLTPGNYLLQHLPQHGPFVALLEEIPKKISDCYNLHADYQNWSVHPSVTHPWIPIDCNFILPTHKANNHMPGMFKYPMKIFRVKKTKKGAKKKKSNNCNKTKDL